MRNETEILLQLPVFSHLQIYKISGFQRNIWFFFWQRTPGLVKLFTSIDKWACNTPNKPTFTSSDSNDFNSSLFLCGKFISRHKTSALSLSGRSIAQCSYYITLIDHFLLCFCLYMILIAFWSFLDESYWIILASSQFYSC